MSAIKFSMENNNSITVVAKRKKQLSPTKLYQPSKYELFARSIDRDAPPRLTSSSENNTPPMGAPNATETPAAAAADSISRIFASL